MTVALLALVCWLAVALFVVCLFWRSTTAHLREVEARARNLTADLDALSIAGPAVDTATGSHDRLPIRDDIRAMLTDYVEGMWHHTQEMP